jgi:histone deacetylase 1/2
MCTVSELQDLRRAFERRQGMLSSGNPKGFESSANSASCGGGGRGYYKKNNQGRPHGREEDNGRNGGGGRHLPQGGRGRGRGRGHGGDPPRFHENIVCQICKKEGHSAYTCWWRYADNDNDYDYDEKEVNAAYGVDTNWYIDTGATDHITGNLEKLMIHAQYHGKDKIHTANGEGMHISYIGHSSIQTPNHELHLKTILHVPSAT